MMRSAHSVLKWYRMDVVDSLVDEGEVEREQTIMDEHNNGVANIFVSLKELSSPAHPMIKTEKKKN